MPLTSDSKSASGGVDGWFYGAAFFALLAALAPFGVNLAVGISPVFADNLFMDSKARAATVALVFGANRLCGGSGHRVSSWVFSGA